MIFFIFIFVFIKIQAVQTNNQPLLKVQYSTDTLKQFQSFEKYIKTSTITSFIQIIQLQCKDQDNCPNFKLYDPYNTLLQQIKGNAANSRYLNIIEKYIDLSNYPTEQVGKQKIKLHNEELAVQVYKQRRRLMSLQRSQDWQKSTSVGKKHSIHHKAPKLGSDKNQGGHRLKSGSNNEQSHQSDQIELSSGSHERDNRQQKAGKNGSRFQDIKNTQGWKWGFILMTIGLILGMRYLKSEQQRINKINNSSPINHHFQQNEILNNQ